MIELNANTVKLLTKAVKNKNNKVMNIVSKKADGATELSRVILGNANGERNQVANFLKGIIPENCGKVFCTFY